MHLSALVRGLVELYSWMIFARLVLSWLRLDLDHPALRPARQLIPPAGGLDFSPIIVFIVLRVMGDVLQWLLRSIGL